MPVDPEAASSRSYRICPSFEVHDKPDQIFTTCKHCKAYHPHCCFHRRGACCHNHLVFVDGACFNNGRPDAVAGIGGTSGVEPSQSLQMSVDEVMDGESKRSNQRAELLAAIHGLEFLLEQVKWKTLRKRRWGNDVENAHQLVIALDSKYVHDGISNWVYTWERNGWRTSQGKRPVNMDLFKRLHDRITQVESTPNLNIRIVVWWIPREENMRADALAKAAANTARPVNPPTPAVDEMATSLFAMHLK